MFVGPEKLGVLHIMEKGVEKSCSMTSNAVAMNTLSFTVYILESVYTIVATMKMQVLNVNLFRLIRELEK